MVTTDFNSCLDQKDKKGGKSVSSTSRGGFRDCIDANGLIDIGFSGYAYTWTNRRIGKENIQERLDRCFANGEWRVRFPNAFVNHLTCPPLRPSTDPHKSLLTKSLPTQTVLL